MTRKKATICVLAAGVLWGCISLFIRPLSAAGIAAMDVAAIRLVISAVGMLAVILVVDRRLFRIRLRDLWMFAGTGIVSVTLFNLCYITCMNISENSIAVVLLYTSPIFVMLLAALFFKERVTGRKVAAVALTFAGCVLVAGLLGGGFRLTPFALLVGVASGFFYGTYSIFGRVALKRYDPLTVTFYTFVLGAAACLVLGDPPTAVGAIARDPSLVWSCLGLGIVSSLLPFLLYTVGLKALEAGKAAILATVEPMVGSLLGIFAYGESVGVQKVAGMLLILAAIVLVNTGKHRDASSAENEPSDALGAG